MGEEPSPEVSPPLIDKPETSGEKRVSPHSADGQLPHRVEGTFVAPAPPSALPPTRHFQQLIVNTVNFTIPSGYSTQPEDVRYLGGGAYGNVIKTKAMCKDGVERYVAIKKLKEPFLDPLQCRRIYREIRLLQLMKHDNIIKAIDIYTPDSIEHKFKDVYVVTEYAGDSLFKILRDQTEHGVKIIQPEHVQFIIYQILRALKYIHSANIIHRDLKPGNLALTKDSDLTVLDFGLARSLEPRSPTLTQYVMTRWYRSPEVIYWNITNYDIQADIWSVGCIAAELMTGRPLFPGEDGIRILPFFILFQEFQRTLTREASDLALAI
ncbi:hypothetical protein WR25_26617 [Diploscapter pachys]|uniref:Protein kinase domain-containing protein n=1 Tax=Diploscapter pachys TaxID=2018661 RepID=A0A2A2LC81_9BILA|nr:hypothetical protein WR25_26617 [Diploscapter pachys]